MERKMIKKMMIVLVTALVLAVFCVNNLQTPAKRMSDLALENIEALAIGEWTPSGWTCFKEYIDDTSSDLFVVIIRCSDCYTTTATAAYSSGHCRH